MNALLRIGFVALLLISGPVAMAAERVLPAGPETARQGSPQFGALQQRAREKGKAEVIVGLRVPFAAEGRLKAIEVQAQRSDIARAAASFRARFAEIARRDPSSFRAYEFIPFVAMDVTAEELARLAADPDVISISANEVLRPHLDLSIPLVRADEAWDAGFSGAGQTIAIVDTGVDKNHPFLAGKVVSEACYSKAAWCPGGKRSSTAPGSGMPCALRSCSHGTHVAGIAAGLGRGFSGVARQASIISIQAFSPDKGEEVAMYTSDAIAALERVYALRNSFTIAAVNMSFGAGLFSSSCDGYSAAATNAAAGLASAGIASIVSSGNEWSTTSIGFPACVSSAISVGSVSTRDWGTCMGRGGPTAADKVACYSNSSAKLSLLAPGSPINSSIPGGRFEVLNGTSMAAPHVAGAWAVLKQRKPDATVAQILDILQKTGVTVVDHRNGRQTKRIDIKAAVEALGVGETVLSYARAGAGTGTVTFSPAGSLGSCAASCVNAYSPGTVVTLTAAAAEGSVFAGWSGACSGTGSCSVTLSDSRAVTATFKSDGSRMVLTYNKSGTGLGTASFAPASGEPACRNSCSKTYKPGTKIRLQAAADPSAVFAGWSGACRGTGSCVITMKQSMSVTAVFNARPVHTLTYTAAGNGSGTVNFTPAGEAPGCTGSCSRNYVAGSRITLSALPAPGSVFSGWSGACKGKKSCSVLMRTAQSVTATFTSSRTASNAAPLR